jgi:hypothetical protein
VACFELIKKVIETMPPRGSAGSTEDLIGRVEAFLDGTKERSYRLAGPGANLPAEANEARDTFLAEVRASFAIPPDQELIAELRTTPTLTVVDVARATGESVYAIEHPTEAWIAWVKQEFGIK